MKILYLFFSMFLIFIGNAHSQTNCGDFKLKFDTGPNFRSVTLVLPTIDQYNDVEPNGYFAFASFNPKNANILPEPVKEAFKNKTVKIFQEIYDGDIKRWGAKRYPSFNG